MKRLLLLSVMAMLTMVSFGRKHVENATIVADTIFYAQNKMSVVSSADASYYRLLMTVGQGMNKQDVLKLKEVTTSLISVMITIPLSMVSSLHTILMVVRNGTVSM